MRCCNVQLSAPRPMQLLPSRGYFFVVIDFRVQFPQPSLFSVLRTTVGERAEVGTTVVLLPL